MNESLFMEELEQFLVDVRTYSVRFYKDGVPPERVVGIAINVADGLAMKRAVQRQRVAGVPGLDLRTIRHTQSQ